MFLRTLVFAPWNMWSEGDAFHGIWAWLLSSVEGVLEVRREVDFVRFELPAPVKIPRQNPHAVSDR